MMGSVVTSFSQLGRKISSTRTLGVGEKKEIKAPEE
jgi:hypothetical protein